VAALVTLAVGMGLALSACGTTRLGGLKVSSQVVSNGSTADTTSVPQSTEVEVRITVTNVSANSVDGVTVRVVVPAGFTYLTTATTTVNGNSERSADISPRSKEATLTWGAWAMGPGNSGGKSQVLITPVFEATGSPGTAPVAPQVFATGYVNTLSGIPLDLTISPAPSLSLQLHVSPATATSGQLVTYQLVVTNSGSGEAPDTSIELTMPDDFDFAGSGATSGNAGTGGASYPNLGSELPVWSGFDLPGAGSGGPGSLSLSFSVEVLSVVPQGIYTCSASLVASTGSQTQNYIQQTYTALAPLQVT
jgi:large repetitive protein